MSEVDQLRSDNTTSESPALSFVQTDGPMERGPSGAQKREAGDLCAIFVHAGAGYHSIQNERIHLSACEDAARSAMTFLNNGASALDAVEMAIKVLEDKDITNAGFGSNLTMEGMVECDATIVDHFGRSGAVGAVPCVRNPIALARLILDHSTLALSLRRVPPNLLVGSGATDYAEENEMKTYHPDVLVSPGAGERYKKWRTELEKAGPHGEDEDLDMFHSAAPKTSTMAGQPDAHNLTEAPCWNESQPYSPSLTPADTTSFIDYGDSTRSSSESRKRRHSSMNKNDTDGRDSESSSSDEGADDRAASPSWLSSMDRKIGPLRPDVLEGLGVTSDQMDLTDDTVGTLGKMLPDIAPPSQSPPQALRDPVRLIRGDNITDTVGAIAVDCFGNIAAGSSSGGIGMKHKGRVGPAALVGIGTAVVPAEPGDESNLSVAAVTSGTGEHMATSMAAATCANRLYTSTKRGDRGSSDSTDDDSAIKSFVEQDFMGHPSVRYSHSAGAIGVLGVKKVVDGIYLYFAHNTDSFAVASMGSGDSKPKSVMSRNKGDGKVITGARKIRTQLDPSWGWSSSPWSGSSERLVAGPSLRPQDPKKAARKPFRAARNKANKTKKPAA